MDSESVVCVCATIIKERLCMWKGVDSNMTGVGVDRGLEMMQIHSLIVNSVKIKKTKIKMKEL